MREATICTILGALFGGLGAYLSCLWGRGLGLETSGIRMRFLQCGVLYTVAVSFWRFSASVSLRWPMLRL